MSAGTIAPLELLEETLLNPEAKELDREEKDYQPPEDAQVSIQDQSAMDTSEDIGHSPDDALVSLQDEAIVDMPEDIGNNDQSSDSAILGPEDLERHIQEGDQSTIRQPSFFYDLKGDSLPDATSQPPVIPDRPDTANIESSDEEVILFKGRDNLQTASTTRTTITMSQIRTEIQVVEDQLETISPQKRPKNRRGGKGRHRQQAIDDEDDAMIADYIANMRETGEISDFLESDKRNRRDLGGSLSDDSSDEEDLAAVMHEKAKLPNGDSNSDEFLSGSELDDETLAKLIAGQDPNSLDPDADIVDLPSDSDFSDAIMTRAQDLTAIEQLDLMDWERPSLRRNKKGKAARAQINFGLSDSELEQQLQVAYKNDRLKKSQRKKQREELRALGQLGKNSKGPEDMMVKYPGGMTMDQVADEMRSFMLSGRET